MKHYYIIKVEATELVGIYEEVEIYLDEYVDFEKDEMFFYDIQEIIDAGDEQLFIQNSHLEEDGDYDEEDIEGMYWRIASVDYKGTVEEDL